MRKAKSGEELQVETGSRGMRKRLATNEKVRTCQPAGAVTSSPTVFGESLESAGGRAPRKLVPTSRGHELQTRMSQEKSVIKNVTVTAPRFLHTAAGGGWDLGAGKHLRVTVIGNRALVFIKKLLL